MALTDREQCELDAVTAALHRLQEGPYGRCDDCGDDIPFDRLQAKPWAQRCVACATRFEQRSR
ncbi:TraR/DksA family transcriptional regulator [Piscinibacter sakaiensis]|uniref:TraR/DksA family transcriptional regulator n=1 Tax=Piscinibacter sakaiensis TaxID=1547922 RepID=UPI003AAD08B1